LRCCMRCCVVLGLPDHIDHPRIGCELL